MEYPTIDLERTGAHIRQLMQLKGARVRDVQEYLNLASPQSVYQWFYGKNLPSVDNLYALSQFFGLPIDYILCGNRGGMNYYHRAACLEWYLTHYGHEGREIEGCKQELEPFML